jgi:hypothetical protein
MNTLSNGIQAALLLARGRADGLALLDSKPNEAMALAARSFWAVAAALPGFVALHLIDWAASGQTTGIGHDFAADLIGFIVGWLGFAVISHRAAALLGRQALWPRYIAAWNWCNVVQYLMLVVGSLPVLLGLPDWVVETCWIVATGWALWLEYFTTRLALALPARQAIALVVLDFGLGIAVAMAMTSVSGG